MFQGIDLRSKLSKRSPPKQNVVQEKLTNVGGDDGLFSIGEEDTENAGMSNFVDLELPETNINNDHPRRNSTSSMASDISFLPRYDSFTNVYHPQSDWEESASELEVETDSNLEVHQVSKAQIYQAFQKALKRYHRYRDRYKEIATHYRLLERENSKIKSILVETQDKSLRRVSELREQCTLEQTAKAHLENALRIELDEKQYTIDTLKEKLQILKGNSSNGEIHQSNLVDISEELQPRDDLEMLTKYLKDARLEIENLNMRLQEMKANSIVFHSKESDFKKRINDLEEVVKKREIENEQIAKRERENNLKIAETKMELHAEIESRGVQIEKLKHELEKFEVVGKQSKLDNLQSQNVKLIEKVENLTQKCNQYESDLLYIEQYKLEIKNLTHTIDLLKTKHSSDETTIRELTQRLENPENQTKSDENQKLQEEISILTQKLQDSELNIEKLREETKQLLLDVERKVRNELTDEFAQKNPEIDVNQLKIDLETFESNYRKLQNQHSNCHALNDQLSALKQQNESDANELTVQKEINQQLIDQLDNLRADSEQNINKLQKQLKEQRETIDGLNESKQQLEMEIERNQMELKQLNEKLNLMGDIQRENSELNVMVDRLQTLTSEQQRKHDDLMILIENDQKSMRKITEENLELIGHISELERKISTIDSQLVATSSELETNKQQQQTLEDDLKTKTNEFNELIARNQQLLTQEKIYKELLEDYENVKVKHGAEIVEMQTRNSQLSLDNRNLMEENEKIQSELIDMRLVIEKQSEEKQETVNRRIIELEEENRTITGRLREVDETHAQCNKEMENAQTQLRELEHHLNELTHEKQLMNDEIVELKTAPVNNAEKDKEINYLNDQLTQYKSLDLTNRTSIQFYESEVEKLNNKNEKLNRKLDETLVTLNHFTQLTQTTETEYLKNVLFNYMMGKESMILARVIAAVCKFDDKKTEAILQREQQKQTLLGQLGFI